MPIKTPNFMLIFTFGIKTIVECTQQNPLRATALLPKGIAKGFSSQAAAKQIIMTNESKKFQIQIMNRR